MATHTCCKVLQLNANQQPLRSRPTLTDDANFDFFQQMLKSYHLFIFQPQCKHIHKHQDIHIGKQTHVKDSQTDKQKDRNARKHTGRQTDTQTNGQMSIEGQWKVVTEMFANGV